MQFIETPLKGAFLIKLDKLFDKRGFFARTFCIDELKNQGLETNFLQCSTCFNYKKGLIRGFHYQTHPYEETKILRCTKGAIYDVIIDLREDSVTYKQYFAVELTAENGDTLYIPKSFAHGYQVLEDNTELFYMMDEKYVANSATEISPFSNEIERPEWPLPPYFPER